MDQVVTHTYIKKVLNRVIVVDNIYSIHYFEFSNNIIIEGEQHDFWEIVYIDKGEIWAVSDENRYKLHQGEMIFHKPRVFHNIITDGIVAPNIIIVSFDCNSAAMEYFADKILTIGRKDKELLSSIIREGTEAFTGPFNIPYSSELKKRYDGSFGAEQMLMVHLEELLINMIREAGYISKTDRVCSISKEHGETDLVDAVIAYMSREVGQNLKMNDLCIKFNIGRTYLRNVFKKMTGQAVMSYFAWLKIEEAKRMIREKSYNFTQIADLLGFSSIHYFSAAFKNITHMTPSEYAVSVKAKVEI